MSLSFDELTKISNNPSRVIATVFNDIENSFLAGSGTLNSTDHPFAYCVDLIVGSTFGFISKLGDSTAESFRAHARTIGDLSKTMSDADWYGVFAEPSSTMLRYMISEEALNNAAIRYNEADGNLNNTYRKLVLPPDTKFNVAGIPFLLENPVEIRVMDHGGYEVVYDSTRQSLLNPLSTNTPDVDHLDIDRRRWLSIHLPVRQLAIKNVPNRPINPSSGFRESITFTDSLYAVRAFITPDGSITRSEMAVVFNNEVYDPSQATLVVDMQTDTTIEVSVPPVYLQNGIINSARITILVYTTKGEYYRDFSTLQSQYFDQEYYDFAAANGALNQYEKPFAAMNEVLVDSLAPITGGRNATSFEELKNLLIYGHRQRLIPISNTDISQFMLRNGYSSVKSLDGITSRLYRVTKDLPIQDSKLYQDSTSTKINSAMGTNVGSVLTSLDELVASGWGIDNGLRVTLPQRTVFDISAQSPLLMPKTQFNALMASSNQNKIDSLKAKTYAYTPFAYVFDTTKNRAACRIYQLASPTIRYQTFRFENATLGLQVSIGAINIAYQEDGYKITIETSSSDAYKQLDDSTVGIQLSLTPTGSSTTATMKATLLGKTKEGERQFSFFIPSNYDVTDADQIVFGGMHQFGREQDKTEIALNTVANFIFTYGGSQLELKSSSDMKIDQTLFSSINIAIIETEYVVQFGQNLGSLYTRIRPMVGEAQYQKYTENVPQTYATNQYKYEMVDDGEGNQIKKLVIVDGKAVIEYHAGEQVINLDGSPSWRFLKGQTVYDDQNQPVPLEPRKMKYYWDFVGFDFNYLVSQDDYDTEYMSRIESFFVDEVIAQLDAYNKITLDETKLVFKPRSTMGFTTVIINEAIQRTVKNDLSFSVTYLLTKEGMRNQNLKDNLDSTTHSLINDILRKNTVSLSDIVSTLKTNGGSEVIDVNVIASAGDFTIDAITNVDSTNGFSVRKLIEQTADKFLTIKEDIDTQFKRHKPDSMD